MYSLVVIEVERGIDIKEDNYESNVHNDFTNLQWRRLNNQKCSNKNMFLVFVKKQVNILTVTNLSKLYQLSWRYLLSNQFCRKLGMFPTLTLIKYLKTIDYLFIWILLAYFQLLPVESFFIQP